VTMTEREALAVLRGDDPARAARAANALWQMWHQSGRSELDALLLRGIEAMQSGRLEEADGVFTRLIDAAPEFAEGWNKRATVRYMAKDYASSIADCRETLARNPNHFGALSGQGLCHMALGEYREAEGLFRRTLAVHPHLDSGRANLRTAVNELVKWN
jgi:tetratricopeptide (TPR) repeat protein